MGSREGWVMGKMIRWYRYMLNFIPIAATPLRLVPMTQLAQVQIDPLSWLGPSPRQGDKRPFTSVRLHWPCCFRDGQDWAENLQWSVHVNCQSKQYEMEMQLLQSEGDREVCISLNPIMSTVFETLVHVHESTYWILKKEKIHLICTLSHMSKYKKYSI